MVTCGGCVLWHAGGEHLGKDDVDVDAGVQDIMCGYVSEEPDLCHVSHTPDGNSFEEEVDRRAGKKVNDGRKNGDMRWLRPRACTWPRMAQDIM